MTTSPCLILHADDFGETAEITAGICQAIEAGVVTSTSIMANMPGTEDALPRAAQLAHRASFGVHLNFCEGRPLTPCKSLVDERGNFHGKRALFLRAVRGSLSLAELEAEVTAQIARVHEARIPISHADGHKHLHQLPLVRNAMRMLADSLTAADRVAIVVYAGGTGLVLPPTTGDRKQAIIQTLDRLEAGGSTNGAGGIQLAYETAVANFIRGGVNRVVLCTDGDFNVGITNQGDLTRLIEDKARSGVFLSVLGFGMGNLKDSTMEQLADKGNGNYAYVDSLNEARKVLVEEMGGTLMTVAKDVKIQVDFNPAQVSAYRLIGYENRALRNEDFNDDAKDAGDMGAGHTVTALFEVVPPSATVALAKIDESKYRQPAPAAAADRRNASNEMLTVRVRYKLPDAADSTRFDVPLIDRKGSFEAASPDYRFAAAVAEFGMVLRESPYRGQLNLDDVLQIAENSRGLDKGGYRQEFIQLVRKAQQFH